MSQQNTTADYFRTQAKLLRKDLQSKDSARRAGALWRVRRAMPMMESLPDDEVRSNLRHGGALHVLAREQECANWGELARKLEGTDGTADLTDVPDDGRRKRISIGMGNSHPGPIGAVLHVYATNADEALQIAREVIPEMSGELVNQRDRMDVEYFQAYFNPEALTAAEIFMWEYIDEE